MWADHGHSAFVSKKNKKNGTAKRKNSKGCFGGRNEQY